MATRNKSIFSFTTFGILLIILSFVLAGIFFYQDDKMNDWLSQYPELNGETELRDALKKDPAIYLLKDMVATGEPCQDYLEILDTPYIYISYKMFEYQRVSDGKKSWSLVSEREQPSEQLVFFNDILVEPGEYTAFCHQINLADNVLPEYLGNVYDPEDTSYTYYPIEPGTFLGNTKYELSGIPVGSHLACVAEVGNGKIRLISYKDDELPAIAGDNDMANLTYEMDEFNGGIAAASVITFMTGVVTFIFGLV